jgi:plastocyanin/mono/diheme cytochrome c family protein
MVGLVALATVLTVYIAREPDRRDSETVEQEDLAIERGTDLYIKYCLQCHAPDGTGRDEAGTDRIGAPLNQDAPGVVSANKNVNFQSDNPADQETAEDWLHYRITYGVPAEPYNTNKIMPAFGSELNVQEINDLVYMIMHVDWDYVYNKAVTETGQAAVTAQCDAEAQGTPTSGDLLQYCNDVKDAPAMYPTAPPTAAPSNSGGAAAEGQPEASPAAEAAATIHAEDSLSWSPNQVTVKPGDTIAVVATTGLEHDFVVDELGINEALPPNGETVMVTIPEDAKPGDYTFYCSIPGHRESGMEGTLTIEG